MINKITICPDGHIIPDSDCLGRTGENNATVLRFDFFEDLNGKSVSDFQKFLVVILPEGVLRYPIEGDFSVPEELTACDELAVLVEIKEDDELLFKSCPHIFTFIQTGDNPEVNVIQSAVDAAKKGCCDDLSSSLETATGEAQDGKTWDELNETVSTLPVISEEQTQALGDWDLIKAYFENYRGNSHHLFTVAPMNADGASMTYSLPYIYTPNLLWRADSVMLSTYLSEVGADVSSAVNLGGGGTNRTFSPLPRLKRLVLTGNANSPSLYNFMTTNYELRYIKMETPSKSVLEANSSYYKRAFYRCERLVTIDCELDFTGQTDLTGIFTNCFFLRNLRIKPFTLTCSLSVKECHEFIHPDNKDSSLLSILNAIPNDREENANITVTYSNYAWVLETSDWFPTDFVGTEVYFNQETGLYSYERQTEADRKTDLYDAFVYEKGVTLAR